jgi:hypothetical protein
MLSSQMLSGIPEVDLGIEEKIRNIEATESAKKRLQREEAEGRLKKKPSEFVPSNLAVNFKRPNRDVIHQLLSIILKLRILVLSPVSNLPYVVKVKNYSLIGE